MMRTAIIFSCYRRLRRIVFIIRSPLISGIVFFIRNVTSAIADVEVVDYLTELEVGQVVVGEPGQLFPVGSLQFWQSGFQRELDVDAARPTGALSKRVEPFDEIIAQAHGHDPTVGMRGLPVGGHAVSFEKYGRATATTVNIVYIGGCEWLSMLHPAGALL